MRQHILWLPNWKKLFFIICDASQTSIEAMVAQEYDGFEYPIAYFSKSLTPAQRGYHSYELEVLSLIQALKAFESYTWGTKLKVVTDCRALVHWNTTVNISQHMSVYLSMIQSVSPQFIHRPGALIPVADALSRDKRFNQYCDVKAEDLTSEELNLDALQSMIPGR